MREIFARMAELEREGRRFAVATVVRTTGSTPQVVGAKLLVDDLGRLVGTLGGGCVEGDAFIEAKRVIETSEPSLREYELTEELAWDTGLVCGGTMWISIEPGERVLRFAGRDLLGDVLAASAGGNPVALATLMRKHGRDLVAAGKLFATCLRAAVKTEARYVGLLGSKRKTILIAQMLRSEGVSDERIRAVHAPIGLDLGGRTPAEIALSVMSELSLERYGGTGRPLRLPEGLLARRVSRGE